MAKVREPLKSSAARGRMGEIVFTHGAGGDSLVRAFKKPSNPKTALQTAQRDKFTAAQGMYLRGFNDYPSVLNTTGRGLLGPYLAAIASFKTNNPVQPKSFANGFESGRVLNRDYAIGHSLRNGLLVQKRAGGVIFNASPTSVSLIGFDASGAGLTPISVLPNATATIGSTAVLLAVTKAPFIAANWNSIDDVGTSIAFGNNNSELIVIDTMREFA